MRRGHGWPTRATIRPTARGRLKRVIQKYVQDPLAEQILAGQVLDGAAVDITVRDGSLAINGAPVKQAA